MVAFVFGIAGEFLDDEGQTYSVDAGMSGLAPIELAGERNRSTHGDTFHVTARRQEVGRAQSVARPRVWRAAIISSPQALFPTTPHIAMGRSFRLSAALAFCTVFLAACGGGDGEPEAETPSQPVFNVEASLAQLLQTAGEFELTGRDPLGEEMRLVYRFVPDVPADPRVPGTLATFVEQWAPALPDRRGGTTYYYTVNPFRLVARTLSTSGLMFYTQTAEIPDAAAAGSGGGFAQGQEPESTQIEWAGWEVRSADAPGTAWVCLETAQIRSGAFLCGLTGPQGIAPRRRAGGWWTGAAYELQSPP